MKMTTKETITDNEGSELNTRQKYEMDGKLTVPNKTVIYFGTLD